jgi:hypothetical protein
MRDMIWGMGACHVTNVLVHTIDRVWSVAWIKSRIEYEQ